MGETCALECPWPVKREGFSGPFSQQITIRINEITPGSLKTLKGLILVKVHTLWSKLFLECLLVDVIGKNLIFRKRGHLGTSWG